MSGSQRTGKWHDWQRYWHRTETINGVKREWFGNGLVRETQLKSINGIVSTIITEWKDGKIREWINGVPTVGAVHYQPRPIPQNMRFDPTLHQGRARVFQFLIKILVLFALYQIWSFLWSAYIQPYLYRQSHALFRSAEAFAAPEFLRQKNEYKNNKTKASWRYEFYECHNPPKIEMCSGFLQQIRGDVIPCSAKVQKFQDDCLQWKEQMERNQTIPSEEMFFNVFVAKPIGKLIRSILGLLFQPALIGEIFRSIAWVRYVGYAMVAYLFLF